MKKQTQLLSALALSVGLTLSASFQAVASIPGQVADQAPLPSLAPMLEKVLPAVVSVRVEGTASQGQKIPEEFKKFFGDELPDQPAQPFEGLGSGVIIDAAKGYVVTNNHVVVGAATLKATVGGKSYDARILGTSECLDLAVIKLDGKNFPHFAWYTGDIKAALEVWALGYPNVGDREFAITKGIVSKADTATNTQWASVNHAIEHDARIRGGQLRGDGVEVIGRGDHGVGGTGGSGGILCRGHVQHNVRRCERIFQRGGVRVRVQCAHTVRVGVGVGFVRQCGVVLGHEQLERLQRCAADGVGHGAFNAALLDAGVHNFACVVGQA